MTKKLLTLVVAFACMSMVTLAQLSIGVNLDPDGRLATITRVNPANGATERLSFTRGTRFSAQTFSTSDGILLHQSVEITADGDMTIDLTDGPHTLRIVWDSLPFQNSQGKAAKGKTFPATLSVIYENTSASAVISGNEADAALENKFSGLRKIGALAAAVLPSLTLMQWTCFLWSWSFWTWTKRQASWSLTRRMMNTTGRPVPSSVARA